MNPGGEPERDDTGLPPVDIEIPDDARELDRDVQAYHRELRAVRRHQRRTRWHRSFGRDGIVLPMLACCLILALITGTLLTVFTATSNQNLTGLPGAATSGTGSRASGGSKAGQGRTGSTSAAAGSSSASGSPTGAAGPDTIVAGRLPNAVIAIDSLPLKPVSSLRKAMVVLVPKACDCAATLFWLAGVASAARATAYLIYSPGTETEVKQLYAQLDSRLPGTAVLAQETDGVLTGSGAAPPGIPAGKLTAIMVDPHGVATWASNLSTADLQAPLVHAITG